MKQKLLLKLELTSNPHEADGLVDLMMPTLAEEIKELCKTLKTKPEAETQALFGDVSFYRLKHSSAEQLASRLRREIAMRAWNMAYEQHNAPDHDKRSCLVCGRGSV